MIQGFFEDDIYLRGACENLPYVIEQLEVAVALRERLITLLQFTEHASVDNRHSCIGCQHLDHALIIAREFTIIFFIRQVNLAQELPSRQDGHAQEGGHGRVVRWKTNTALITRDIRDPDGAPLPG